VAGADATVRVDFVANTRGLQKGAAEAQSATSRLGGTLKGLAKGGAIAGAALIGIEFKRTIEAASELEESMNAVNVVFGDSASIVQDFAKGAAKSAGLSMAEANKLIVPNGAGLQNYGFSAEQAAKSSVTLAQRAADMASVLNTDVPTALQAIQSGLKGEADPLEQYGVNLSAAKVNAEALAMGLADTTSALTDQDKATARVALIMKQTDKYAGDFKNTSGGLANTQRILRAELTNVEAQIGQKLLPVIVQLIAFVREHWPEISAVIGAAWRIIRPLLEALGALIVALVDLIRDNWGTIGPIVMAAVDVLRKAAAIIADVIGIVTALLRGDWSKAWQLAQKTVQDVVKLITAILKYETTVWRTILTAAWDAIKALTGAAWELIKAGVNAAVQAVTDQIRKIPAAISSAVQGVKNAAGQIASAITDAIGDAARAVVRTVGDQMDRIGDRIEAVVGSVRRAAGNVASAIKGPINAVISAWNGLAFHVPSFTVGGQKVGPLDVPKASFGGQTIAFPDLPRLAAGGVLDRATLFVGGEAGREIVTPERLLRQIMRDEGAGSSYTLNLTTQRADAQDIAWGFRRLELLRTGR